MVLLKSNHMIGVAGPKAAFERVARRNTKRLPVEIEVRDIEEFSEALGLPVARIMLDNMSVGELRQAVALARRMNDGRRLPLLEASGGITLANVRAIAETGVDLISVGALTHSVEAIDVSFTIHE
jgi:nicotinate-nucleotide pyrophosphorylase (carboxylating)